MLETISKVILIGGSTAEGYGVDAPKAFGRLLSQHLQCDYEFHGFHLLLARDAYDLLHTTEVSDNDLVILMLGIADGWRQPRGLFLKMLPASWRGAGKLNPATRPSRSLKKRIRQRVRHLTKYLFKLIAWSTLMYRPPTQLSQFKNDMLALADSLNNKSKRTIIMTPQKPRRYSTWLEIHTIERYTQVVREIIAANQNVLIQHFDSDEHIDSKHDLLLDGIHLSEVGHEKIALALATLTTSAGWD